MRYDVIDKKLSLNDPHLRKSNLMARLLISEAKRLRPMCTLSVSIAYQNTHNQITDQSMHRLGFAIMI